MPLHMLRMFVNLGVNGVYIQKTGVKCVLRVSRFKLKFESYIYKSCPSQTCDFYKHKIAVYCMVLLTF